MTQKTFWLLRSPETNKKLADWDDDVQLEGVKCPVNEDHQRAGKRLTDLSVTLPGSLVEDFVWTWASECLIQDHVLHLLERKGFSGFQVKPVTARFEKEAAKHAPKLWELIVTGWAGLASPESGIKLVERCDACLHMHYSQLTHPERLLDDSQWDGSDFFMVWPLPKFIFITDRVVQTIRQENWQGVGIKDFRDVLWGDGGFSPGRLSHWMPDQRARQLGERLGIY